MTTSEIKKLENKLSEMVGEVKPSPILPKSPAKFDPKKFLKAAKELKAIQQNDQ